MIDSTKIREGMVVYSSEGEKLGKVLSCDRESFIIEKGFFFPKDYIARYEDVADVTGDDVRLLRARASLESGEASVPHDRTGNELGYGAAGAAPAAVEGSMNASGVGLGATRAELPDIASGATAPAIGSPDYETRREIPGQDTADAARMTRAEEDLDVVKRERDAGEVRLVKDVVTETKRIDVPVTREEVRVERVPLAQARPAESSEAAFKKETISVPVREEEVEVRKRPVVREEVRLRKDRVVEQRAAEAEVRKERIDVDDSSRTIREDENDPLTRK